MERSGQVSFLLAERAQVRLSGWRVFLVCLVLLVEFPVRSTRATSDFMFQLTSKEKAEVVANCDHLVKLKFSPAKPFAFTEHGAVMVASVLNSKRAIEVSVYVVRAFVKVREVLGAHSELAQKLTELERRVESHDTHIRSLFDAIRQLMEPPTTKSRRIGFKT
jgi:hypothetical protein